MLKIEMKKYRNKGMIEERKEAHERKMSEELNRALIGEDENVKE